MLLEDEEFFVFISLEFEKKVLEFFKIDKFGVVLFSIEERKKKFTKGKKRS